MKPNTKFLPVFLIGTLAMLAALFPGSDSPAAATEEPDIRRDATVQAVAQVMPSVVNIRTRMVVRGALETRFGLPGRTSESLGSGVVIDEAGYLLTNEHVVR